MSESHWPDLVFQLARRLDALEDEVAELRRQLFVKSEEMKLLTMTEPCVIGSKHIRG